MRNTEQRLCHRIEDTLVRASGHICEDQGLLDRLRIEPAFLHREVGHLASVLSAELNGLVVSRKCDRSSAPSSPGSLETRTRRSGYEMYVVVPIFNGSDEQAACCINSIIRNLGAYSICLVLYTNRSWRELPGLSTTAVDFIEFRSDSFSLPFAYNHCISYLREHYHVSQDVIVFMDDDAAILDNQSEAIAHNLSLVRKDALLAVSGQYFDETEPDGLFQRALQHTNCASFAHRCAKPYCHGGAVLMMKARAFPLSGLPLEGLGGISLSVLLIGHRRDDAAGQPDWFLWNNPQLQVFHPRKQNLVQWTATYLSYDIAWTRALSWLSASENKMWTRKLQEARFHRTKLLIDDINEQNSASRFALTNLLLTKYYKPLLRDAFSYDDFVSLKLQTHPNL